MRAKELIEKANGMKRRTKKTGIENTEKAEKEKRENGLEKQKGVALLYEKIIFDFFDTLLSKESGIVKSEGLTRYPHPIFS